jgi:hypothetical protein
MIAMDNVRLMAVLIGMEVLMIVSSAVQFVVQLAVASSI